MPGLQSPKIDSGRLLLSASIAAMSAQATGNTPGDYFHALGGALAGSNGFMSAPQLKSVVNQHPEWHWLPSYKWEGLSKHPYSMAGRAWEALSGEIGPVASIFALHYLSKRVGLHYQYLTADDGQAIADYTWRLGEAVGDYATSDTANDLVWRLFASNADLIHSPEFIGNSKKYQNLFWAFKRVVAYVPMLATALPEAVHQHVMHSIGYAGIAFETPALNEHFGLTFISSSSADDPGRPTSAYMDLDFVKRPTTFSEPQGRFEKALVALDEASRDNGVTRVRFYPTILGDQGKSGTLALFVRPYFNHKPGPLIRFPASFGSSLERAWWTDAADRRILHGVYNDDQYTAVKYFNEFMNYKQHLITPISDRVLEQMPAILKWASEHATATNYNYKFEQQIQSALTPEVDADHDGTNIGLPGRPKQSTYHTAINTGDEGFVFIDDYFSQRVELPIFTMVTRNRYGDIKLQDLLKLEKHLPWRSARGSGRITYTALKGLSYSYITSQLMKARSKELLAHKEATKDYGALIPQSQHHVLEMFREYERQLLKEGEELDDAITQQQSIVDSKHSAAHAKMQRARTDLNQERASRTQTEEQLAELKKDVKAKQSENDGAQKKFEAEVQGVKPDKSKNKQTVINELKALAHSIGSAKGSRDIAKANRAYNAFVDNPQNGVKNLAPLLTDATSKQQAMTDAQVALEGLKTDLDNKKQAIEQKEKGIQDLEKNNSDITRLSELKLLKFFKAGLENDDTSDATVQSNLDEFKRNGKLLGLGSRSSSSGLLAPLKEFAGTVINALPSLSWLKKGAGKPDAASGTTSAPEEDSEATGLETEPAAAALKDSSSKAKKRAKTSASGKGSKGTKKASTSSRSKESDSTQALEAPPEPAETSESVVSKSASEGGSEALVSSDSGSTEDLSTGARRGSKSASKKAAPAPEASATTDSEESLQAADDTQPTKTVGKNVKRRPTAIVRK